MYNLLDLYTIFSFKTNLKVLKAQPDAVNGRTDNTMTKRKVTKGQTIIYQTLHIKLKIEHEHQTTDGELHKDNSSCNH